MSRENPTRADFFELAMIIALFIAVLILSLQIQNESQRIDDLEQTNIQLPTLELDK